MYRKRCNVNIILLRFDDAASDLAQAISFHVQMHTTSETTQLTSCFDTQAWLHDPEVSDLSPVPPDLPRTLKDLATRIKFDLGIHQSTPTYDFAAISSYVGPLTLHVNAPNYINGTEVRQTGTTVVASSTRKSSEPEISSWSRKHSRFLGTSSATSTASALFTA
jgi:hypothetical protein